MVILLVIALTLYLAGAFYSIYAYATKSKRPDRDLKLIIGLGFVAHTAAIVAAWREAGHFPVISPKEVSSFIGWAIAGYYLAVSRRYNTRALPAFLLPLVYFFIFVCLLLLARVLVVVLFLECAFSAC